MKKKKFLVYTAMTALFAGCMWLIFSPDDKGKEPAGFNSEVPTPRGGIVSDKRDAYEQERLNLRNQERRRNFEVLYGEPEDGDPEVYARQAAMAPKPADYYDDRYSSAAAHAELTGTLGNFFEEPDTEKESLKAEVERLKTELSARDNNPANEAALLEKSFEIAARYMPGQTAEPTPVAERKVSVVPVAQVRQSAVSSLTTAGVVAAHEPAETAETTNTIAAVVHGDQRLTDGQTVRLRTMDAMQARRYLIPQNTILSGICRMSGERLEIVVSAIEHAGNIIPVELIAHDSDGQRGINIPGSMEMDAVREVVGGMGQGMGSAINFSRQKVGEQLLTDLGRGVIQGTSQYVAKKTKQPRVTLKAGYRIFLVPKNE